MNRTSAAEVNIQAVDPVSTAGAVGAAAAGAVVGAAACASASVGIARQAKATRAAAATGRSQPGFRIDMNGLRIDKGPVQRRRQWARATVSRGVRSLTSLVVG